MTSCHMTLTRTWVVVVYGWLAKHFSAPCVVGLGERNFTLVLLCFAAVYLPRLAWWLVVALLDAPSARRKAAASVFFFVFRKKTLVARHGCKLCAAKNGSPRTAAGFAAYISSLVSEILLLRRAFRHATVTFVQLLQCPAFISYQLRRSVSIPEPPGLGT